MLGLVCHVYNNMVDNSGASALRRIDVFEGGIAGYRHALDLEWRRRHKVKHLVRWAALRFFYT